MRKKQTKLKIAVKNIAIICLKAILIEIAVACIIMLLVYLIHCGYSEDNTFTTEIKIKDAKILKLSTVRSYSSHYVILLGDEHQYQISASHFVSNDTDINEIKKIFDEFEQNGAVAKLTYGNFHGLHVPTGALYLIVDFEIEGKTYLDINKSDQLDKETVLVYQSLVNTVLCMLLFLKTLMFLAVFFDKDLKKKKRKKKSHKRFEY